MPKNEFEHHQPRQIDKRKHHRAGFSEDVQEKRKDRVSFKNYVRQIREQELASEEEQWIVERNDGENSLWEEIAGPFTSEPDAFDMMDELLETAGQNEQFRITRLEE